MGIPQDLSALIGVLETQKNPYWLSYADAQAILNKFGEYGNLPNPPFGEAAKFMKEILPAHAFDDGTRVLLRVPMAELLLIIKAVIDG